MKKRILFVDDEPNVLQGLQRMLRPMRTEWEMAFAAGGLEAMEKLKAAPFDVVVSDMRMPGIDGVQLLTEVMRRYPQIVRIILSGHSDREMILRSVGPTHQYLAKPCDADTLKDAVARACSLRELLSSESLKGLVSRISSLPSLPELYVEVVQELQRPNASIQKVGQIIARDVGMTAKILQLVNSAFFGLSRHVSHPALAVSLLGLDTVKALVLSVQVFSQFDQTQARGFSLPALWKHSVATGAVAHKIAAAEAVDDKAADYALMAGLLHDAGKLVLAANLPDQYGETLALAQSRGIAFWQAEREILGTTHGEVGAYLLGLWGLPDPIVEAIAYHHSPGASLGKTFAPLTAVHVANVLEHETRPAEGAAASALRADYLADLNLTGQIDAWRRICRAMAQDGNARTPVEAKA